MISAPSENLSPEKFCTFRRTRLASGSAFTWSMASLLRGWMRANHQRVQEIFMDSATNRKLVLAREVAPPRHGHDQP
jgi:2-iminoacetate synthase ThiH